MELWHAQVLWLDYADSFTSDKFQINLQFIIFTQFIAASHIINNESILKGLAVAGNLGIKNTTV